MRSMSVPAETDSPRFSVKQHTYNVHLASGKWSVHIDSHSGRGRFYGPLQNEGTIELLGKVVRAASCYLPRQVIFALTDGGYDCAAVQVA